MTVIWNDSGEEPYLWRTYLFRFFRQKLPGVFLHWFFRGDEDRDLHNHPWDRSWSLIVWGGYREERLDPDGVVRVRTYRPFSINRLRANDFHRVDLLRSGCLTLFIAGRRTQRWGFLDPKSGSYEDADARDRRIREELESRGAPALDAGGRVANGSG